MDWIYCKDKMPAETKFHVDGINYYDKKDRDWTESEQVFVAYDNSTYGVACTRNGKFRDKIDCDNFTHSVVAWMPIPTIDIDKLFGNI